MHLYRRRLLLCAPLCLGACFGKVDYGVEDGGQEGLVSGDFGGGAPSATAFPVATGGGDSSSGAGGSETGGFRTGGSEGGEEVRVPGAVESLPFCEEDCCPERLTQVTFSINRGSLDAHVDKPYLSGNGVWLVFSSSATNLVNGDFGAQNEVFSHSLSTGETNRLSIPPGGGIGNGDSEANGVSDDGRWVLLTSWSSNFLQDDENEQRDVFLFDRESLELRLVSASVSGTSGNGTSLGRDISSDGRFVVYSSNASDLTPNDDNEGWDVFVWDRTTGLAERISMGPGDQQTNAVSGNHAHISDDGRFVSFHSLSNQLTEDDGNDAFDIFFTDRERGSTERISRSHFGGLSDGNAFVMGMSGDGRYLSSYAAASNLVSSDTNGLADVFLFERLGPVARRVNLGPMEEEAEQGSSTAALSWDGQSLTFSSAATNLVPDDTRSYEDSFLFQSSTGELTILSRNDAGTLGNGDSQEAHLSRSGRCFVFASHATNLTSQSTDDSVRDLFVGRLP